MTPRQKEVYDFIVIFWEKNGYGPTYKEIMAAMGVTSKGTVRQYIMSLIGHGRINRASKKWRGIVPVTGKIERVKLTFEDRVKLLNSGAIKWF